MDRGSQESLQFHRCERGFVLRSGEAQYDGSYRRVWAFDSIVDLANWLIEQYENPPEPEMKPTAGE